MNDSLVWKFGVMMKVLEIVLVGGEMFRDILLKVLLNPTLWSYFSFERYWRFHFRPSVIYWRYFKTSINSFQLKLFYCKVFRCTFQRTFFSGKKNLFRKNHSQDFVCCLFYEGANVQGRTLESLLCVLCFYPPRDQSSSWMKARVVCCVSCWLSHCSVLHCLYNQFQ